MKFRVILFAALFCMGGASAQTMPQATGDTAMTSAVEDMPDRFMLVTAENGQEWIEQCEWPAQKSDSMARIAACLSFLQGARAVASRQAGPGNCSIEFASQSRGTLLTTTYQIARRYPQLPISKVLRMAFDSIEPGAC